MEAAALSRRDRVCSWYEELERLAPDVPSLPSAACGALRNVVLAILREDADCRLAPPQQRSVARLLWQLADASAGTTLRRTTRGRAEGHSAAHFDGPAAVLLASEGSVR